MKALSHQDLLDIVAAASTIDERLARGFIPDDVQPSEAVVKTRLAAWCQAIARDDWKQFRRRLAWDSLDENMVRRVLGTVRVPEGIPLPAWAETLSEAVNLAASLSIDEAGASQADASRMPFLDAKEPFPFEEMLVPFVLLARRRCIAQAGDAYDLLGEEARVALQRSLLQTLTTNAAQVMYLEFSLGRNRAQSPLEYLLAAAQENDRRQLYQEFVEQMLQGGLVNFFQEYTVLARLLATLTDLWVAATVEFLQQLAADWSDLQQLFGSESALGSVTSVAPSLSDPHRGRRSVIALTFASGHKLVYKPKNLGTEEAYYQLLAWCNARGIPLPFKVLKVLNRSSYGWAEFVEYKPCRDREAAQRYYRRAGMLLCLIYALAGTDCHYENIIASGEYPVLVDLETLMHHRLRLDESEEAQARKQAREQIAHSVRSTGLLPNWQVANDGRTAYDISGLGGIGEQEREVRAPQWRYINTDRMTLEYAPVKMRQHAHGPLLNGVPQRLEEYSEDVIEGFQSMYSFLLEQSEALLEDKSPLQKLGEQQVRFIYRPTRIYNTIRQKLLNPQYLRDGVEWSIQLELLGRSVLPLEGSRRDMGERIHWWPIFAAERQAMTQGDIPHFTADASRDALTMAPGQEIEACFERPGFDLVMTRLQSLDDEDLERQVALIRGSLYAHVAHNVAGTPALSSAEVDSGSDRGDNISSERLLAQARAIAEEITAQAIRAADGSAIWIAPQYLVQAGRYQLQLMGYDLYSGACGVALFLAALAKVSGDTNYGELALGAVQPLLLALRGHGNRTARDMGIGGGSGLGAVIYTLARMSQWLNTPALLEDARQAARLITAERIAGDKALDIITGAAGAILGLLALYTIASDEVVLDRAITCGHHLLQARAESKEGLRAWTTIKGKMLTGFAHGAAGIAYALLRLFAVTGERELSAAAQEGTAYEDRLFVPEEGNWLDLRKCDATGTPICMTSWCHGAPGIGLARLGALSVMNTPKILSEIEVALATTRRYGMQSVDHLCCGSAGRIDLLLEASRRLNRPELAAQARQWMGQVVTSAHQNKAYRLFMGLPSPIFHPGLFQGTAGIAYEMLRLAEGGDTLPSVLLLD